MINKTQTNKEKKSSKSKDTNFRKLILSSGKLVLAGKNAQQNEEIIKQALPNEILFHTKLPGSSFCNIKNNSKRITSLDLKETAIFCAKYSQAWKKPKTKKDIEVHYFFKKNTYKTKDMPLGTFGVKKSKPMKVRKEDLISKE
jgi:predicted ribosome quality control (RQC) complex YloA/Tae2 family protein